MKLAFIFPFYRTSYSRIDGPPLSTPILIGNIKNSFPSIRFEQIDVNLEIRWAISRKNFPEKEMTKSKSQINKLINKHLAPTKEVTSEKLQYRMTEN